MKKKNSFAIKYTGGTSPPRNYTKIINTYTYIYFVLPTIYGGYILMKLPNHLLIYVNFCITVVISTKPKKKMFMIVSMYRHDQTIRFYLNNNLPTILIYCFSFFFVFK